MPWTYLRVLKMESEVGGEKEENQDKEIIMKANPKPPWDGKTDMQEVKQSEINPRDVKAREGIWKDFEQLPPNPAFSTPRVRCVGCGKERSLFLPWMKTHKQTCSARTAHQNGETSSNKAKGTPGKPRDPVWSGFETVPCSKEYSSSRVCCKRCGEQHSVFLPWMRQHKAQCDQQLADADQNSIGESKVESSAQTNTLSKMGVALDTLAKIVHQGCNEEASSSKHEIKSSGNGAKTRPSRRDRKMPTRFADSIVEDVVLQSLGIKDELEWQQVELQQNQSSSNISSKLNSCTSVSGIKEELEWQQVGLQQKQCSSNISSKLPACARNSTFHNKYELKSENLNVGQNKFQVSKRPISEVDVGPGLSIKVFAVDSPLPRELHLTVQNSATGLEVQSQCPNLDEVENSADISHINKSQSPNNVKLKNEDTVLSETELSDDKQKVKMGFMCSKCCNIFLVKEELKQHLYKCRNVKSLRSIRARPKRDYKCPKCSRQFLSKHSLNRHLQRSVCTKTRSKKTFICPSCERRFRDNFALTIHVKACGKRTGGPRQRAVCLHTSCDLRFMHVKAMLDHVRQAHQDVHIDIQEYTFFNLEDFLHWKDIEEAKTLTRYVKNGVRDGGMNCYRSYDCIHNGEDKNKVRLTNRVHGKGKIKTGLFCPARMQTRIMKDGTVSVTFIATHTHEISLQLTQHHRLAKSTIKYIKQQLALGVPERKIQENIKIGFIDPDVRDENGDLVKRRHVVSLTQIAKIGKKMNMQPVNAQINPEDVSGVELLVKRLEGEAFNPIITYKAPGAPVAIGALELDHLPHANILFALGIQTQQQLDIMRGGDTSVLCVDTTYCKKQCDIFLISVLIPDGYGKGYPVAHFITNHQDQVTLHYMFSSLKERYPSLKVGAILTDGNKSGYNAYQGLTRVFGSTHHLICHAYLNKLWKWRLKLAAKNERSLQIEVMSFLTALMREESIDFFQELCQSFAEKYGSVIGQFVNSFTKSFLSKGGQKVEQWAKCYRRVRNYSIESIPYCKDLQDKLKAYFKNQNTNMRIHDLVALLLNFWNNIQVENVSEYIQANTANESEQVWDSEPFLQTIFHSEDLKTTTEALEDLEKLREILQQQHILQQQTNNNSNNSSSQQSEVLQHTAATIKQLVQQWEQVATTASAATVVVSTPHHNVHMHMGNAPTHMEADTAVKNLMGHY